MKEFVYIIERSDVYQRCLEKDLEKRQIIAKSATLTHFTSMKKRNKKIRRIKLGVFTRQFLCDKEELICKMRPVIRFGSEVATERKDKISAELSQQ